ncbi:MAG: multiheme c-type cytochrome [Cyclobacteriaceae bacterium]|nr:multiheme c-type cytochrome [Cyclobacteriaceae bacterium]
MKTKPSTYLIFAGILMAIVVLTFIRIEPNARLTPVDRDLITKSGVCPPFHLYDEANTLIDPIHGLNADKPFSPKQTCGKCHDYDKITEGYHFQQGKDEQATGILAERYQWVSHPGNYGGNWCSPAPLYSYLSAKENTSAKEMDMTSFTFITNGCGTCHPGGGSMEFDRNGFRYDAFMDSVKYTAGGINNFDGDYFKAHWNRSGVAEGECNICHQPDYDFASRSKNLLSWNFKWLATAGSRLARIDGSVKDSLEVKVSYDLSKFDNNGKISMNLVREPRNENCLNCHAKPQWKKRGAAFTAMTDVHIAKGLKCVDCHAAGSMAADDRIKGKEVHQFGKGDDPSGWVRNDLDNTMRTCADCHVSGYMNAPIAKHEWLPALHMDKLSCQACHIPARKVKSAQVQNSDVFNPGTKIKPPAKYVWTFYDQDMNYWNHYGELEMFGFKDQPSDYYYPRFAQYKGQIFPVNMVHSAWPGIYTEGISGLDQPKMKDIYDMWIAHKNDQAVYPALAVIADDNNDMVPEVNRPEEIDAFISSVTSHLSMAGFDLKDKKIVWVNNDRMYFNSAEFRTLDKEPFEASPYASVYKYSHDVFPAQAALGAKGCVECHSFESEMFYANIIKYPFDQEGTPILEQQYTRLGIHPFFVWLSAFREQYIKTAMYPAFILLIFSILLGGAIILNRSEQYISLTATWLAAVYWLFVAALLVVFLKPDVHAFILPERLWFDVNHFAISFISLIAGWGVWLKMKHEHQHKSAFGSILLILLILAAFGGFLMVIKFDAIFNIVKLAYTLFDVSVLLIVLFTIIYLVKKQFISIALVQNNSMAD